MPEQVTRLNAALAGRCRIERQPDEGGTATVNLSRDLRPKRNLALKGIRC
jgi:hypothetical protein